MGKINISHRFQIEMGVTTMGGTDHRSLHNLIDKKKISVGIVIQRCLAIWTMTKVYNLNKGSIFPMRNKILEPRIKS